MNVLSLFDGISCGQVALQRAGITVDNYFASEIDKNAIKVTQHNWPQTQQLGDVTKVSAAALPKIDLIMGGFCCQSFSFAGNQLNFEDPRGKLFFECVRLLEEVRKVNPDVKFLFENVNMKKEFLDCISNQLGVEPFFINSKYFCAQSRGRYYWTNISIEKFEKSNVVFKNVAEFIINKELSDSEIDNQLKTILKTSKYYNTFKWKKDKENKILVTRPDGLKIQRIGRIANSETKTEIITCLTQPFVNDGEKIRKITPLEAERLQTLPDNYTNTISKSQRYKAIGNSWTVDVIAHIFKSLASCPATSSPKV